MLRAHPLVFIALLGLSLPAQPMEPAGVEQPAYVPGRLLVKFKAATFGPARGPQTSYQLPSAAQTALATVNGRVDRAYAGIGWVRVLTDRPVPEAVAALRASGAVDYAEPDWIVHAYATPNDPRFDEQWALHNTGQDGGKPDADIDAPEAWETRTAANAVIVGVVDTGINYYHPDLWANIWTNPGEIPRNGIDDDGNGYIDDIHGINAITYEPTDPRAGNPRDDNGHGTHVAGTIGARGDNGRGVTGVAWRTKLMALKFLGAKGGGATSDAIEALQYARAIQAQYGYPRMVLNNSWGGGPYDPALYQEIALARDAGILFIAAAGNDGTWNDYRPEYPASYDLTNIVRVGATDRNDQPADFSNRGCYTVDLFAPGVDILSTWLGHLYETSSGTSMATPHVAGAAALIWSQVPGKSWRDIKNALLNGANPIPALQEMSVTQGRLNLRQSLRSKALTRPAIWGISPRDPVTGRQITVSGYRFGATPGSLDVDGVPLQVDNWTDTSLLATLPPDLPSGLGRLRVTTAEGVNNPNGACIQVGNQVGATTRVSVDSDGIEGDGQSMNPSISASGRYVTFDSWASNLGQGGPGGSSWAGVYLHDRFTGQTTSISQGMDDQTPDGASASPRISADGRYVAFLSSASNLVPDDTNGFPDIFVRDGVTGAISRVSVGPGGRQADQRSIGEISLSADGRYVAFTSYASNLVDPPTKIELHVYAHDRKTGVTSLVSEGPLGRANWGQATGHFPNISGTGEWVSFSSFSALLPSDANDRTDIYLKNLLSGSLRLLSSGSEGGVGGSPEISGDGRYVTFYTGDPMGPDLLKGDLIFDLLDTREVEYLLQNAEGKPIYSGSLQPHHISATARFVIFNSVDSNLVPGDTNGVEDVFVLDRTTRSIDRVSIASDGSQANRDPSDIFEPGIFYSAISADGRFAAFHSRATTLVDGDSNATMDVFVRDREQLPTGSADIELIPPGSNLYCNSLGCADLQISFKNHGPDETPIRLILVIPSSLGVRAGTLSNACSEHGGIIICDLPNLASGRSSDLTLKLTGQYTGDFTATLTAMGLRRDADLGNNERLLYIHVSP